MKPFNAVISYPADNSFIIKYDNFPHFNVPLHFHNEYEIVYIIKSFGKKYVGDIVEPFVPGDLSFYGHNIHHFYLNDEEFYGNDPEYFVNAIVVLFPSDYFPISQLHQPEFSNIRKLLNNSFLGLKFSERVVIKAGQILQKMLKTTGIERYMLFLRLLDYLGSSESIPLASIGFANSINEFGEHRMEKIYKFCKHNFTRKLSLSEVSSLAAMNQTAFCRYFQKNTGKTFTQFINELRVSLACELLKNSNQTMAFICTKTGFNNMSNFNRVFLKIVGKTPSGYREFYKEE